MEEGSGRSILLETCARNVSCLSCAVSITPVCGVNRSLVAGLAGTWAPRGDCGQLRWGRTKGSSQRWHGRPVPTAVSVSLTSPAAAWSYSPAHLPLLLHPGPHSRLASVMPQPLWHCRRKQREALGVEETPGHSLLSPHPCRDVVGGGCCTPRAVPGFGVTLGSVRFNLRMVVLFLFRGRARLLPWYFPY